MTVLIREELNDADLAWAAADPAVAGVVGQLVQARRSLGAGDGPGRAPAWVEAGPVPPAELRARGAL
ncbi:hypothetical protein [Arenimonas metalli]|uniref:Uncharacterized protein n=1 Tax=Arenimonas metalli CF5-1 TaxID=1384056 RepID=A0A091BQ83_9GAMM|nr:hypothetical protein [Arenimonas metalli]KFN46465.1 hypothetical protein N787_10570 [Arenimonas metalli CF5-1]